LFVSGRKKSLIILDNGKNVFPEDLEFFIMDNIPQIREAVVLEVETQKLSRIEKVIGAAVYVEPADFPGMTVSEVKDSVKNSIIELNRRQPSYKKIQDVVVVTHEFKKNSTRKIIRQNVADNYENYKKES